MRIRGVLALVCLLAGGARTAGQETDVQAVAAAVLAAPPPERAQLLEARGVKPSHALVDAMLVIGGRRLTAADFVGAGEIYDYTLTLARSIGDDAGVHDSLLGLAQVYARRADYARALSVLDESLAIATRLGDQRMLAASLNNQGIVYRLQGEYEAAKENYRRMLAIAEAAHNEDQIARARSNLGIVETYQGMYDAAVADLQAALDIAGTLKNASLVLNGTLNLGNVYYYQGNCALAMDLYGRVLVEAERSGNPMSAMSAMTNMSVCERSRGQLDRSLDHLQRVMALAEEHKLPAEVARVCYGIGVVYRRERRWQEALTELKRSLDVRESIGDRLGIAETLVERGDVQFSLHQYDAALESVTRAASIADELDLPEVAFGARTIQGKTLVALGRPSDAETALRSAIRGVEATRLRVAGSAIDRARYLSEAVEAYLVLARLLADRHRDFDAFVVAEQAHARALAEVVAGHGADDVLTPAERDHQRALQKRLGALNREIDALQPGAANAARTNELGAARRAARLEEERLTSSLYAAHPELRLRLGAPMPLTTSTLARRLDPSTALVEYIEGPDTTLMLVATRGPKGPVVHAHTIAIRGADLDARVAAFNTAIAGRDLGIGAEAGALGALLLEPALRTGRARLVIVPDGALWTLPFHALRSADRYIAEDHVVSYAPSVVALQLLSERHTVPGLGFLGIADPDPAHPLPDARRQVESLAADPALQGRALTGAAATEAAVRKTIGSARIVHVASHGVFEDASPLYSHLVLAPGSGSDTSNDGRLDAWELMQMRLRASLVVLAACETGRGDISSGEGVIGLSWAALAAGAPAAVVSLWRVDESATSAWMAAFYRSWKTLGASRAAADASRALMTSERYKHPFYWAPFVVIGDPSAPSVPAPRRPPASATPRSTGPARRP